MSADPGAAAIARIAMFNPFPGRCRRPWAVVACTVFACVLLLGCAGTSVNVADRLDAADLSLIAATTQQALEKNKVGQSANWTNPANGHLGTVTPTRTLTADSGAPCRNFQQTATVEGHTILAFDRACRDAAGNWFSTRYVTLSQAIREGDSDYAYARRPYAYDYDDPWCRWHWRDPFCHPGYGGSFGFGYRHWH
jgi:surface antigen